jgi:predicted aspartyl protease
VLVPVGLATGSGRFIVDTGASITVLTPATAEGLGIPLDSGRTITAGAVGGTVELRLATVPELMVGDRALQDVRVAILDLTDVQQKAGWTFDGVLGRELFERYDVELDLVGGTMRLAPAGAFARDVTGPDWVHVPFRYRAGMVHLKARLGAVAVDAAIDTGANSGTTNASTATAGGAVFGEGHGASLGADGRAVAQRDAVFPSLQLGDLVLRDVELGVCDDADGRDLLDGEGMRMHLGMDTFAGRRVRFSYRTGGLWMSRQVEP